MIFSRGLIYKLVQGSVSVTDAVADATIIAAPGAGKKIVITKAILTIHTAAVGGAGVLQLENGLNGTAFAVTEGDAITAQPQVFDFGEEGYELSENTLLNLTTVGAVTTQASGSAVVIGYITNA